MNLDKEFEANLFAMISNTSMAFVVSNPRLPGNPIVMCNDSFVDLTRYDRHEIIGRNYKILRGKDTEPEQTQKILDAMDNRQTAPVEITHYKRDGTPFRNAVMIAPSFDDTGQLAYFIGSIMELKEATNQTSSSRQARAIELIKLLSPQQKRVLTQVAKGYLNKQISHILGISVSTVKMHRAQALEWQLKPDSNTEDHEDLKFIAVKWGVDSIFPNIIY